MTHIELDYIMRIIIVPYMYISFVAIVYKMSLEWGLVYICWYSEGWEMHAFLQTTASPRDILNKYWYVLSD